MVGAGGKANETKKSPGKAETASRPTETRMLPRKLPQSRRLQQSSLCPNGASGFCQITANSLDTMSNVYGINGKRIAPETAI